VGEYWKKAFIFAVQEKWGMDQKEEAVGWRRSYGRENG
jgi:hypothetical protein